MTDRTRNAPSRNTPDSQFPPNETSTRLPQRAGLWRRFGAFVHELFFLVAYLFIVALIFAAFSGESMSVGRPQILTGSIAILQQLYLFVSIGVYFIYFWIKGRRTLAFKTWQLRLVSAHDNASAPTTKQAIVRYLATWIGPALALIVYATFGSKTGPLWLIALFANFLWALIDKDRQFLHDRAAGTSVVHKNE
ncbi:MAG: RDD family protein [Casimicrobium sp.]